MWLLRWRFCCLWSKSGSASVLFNRFLRLYLENMALSIEGIKFITEETLDADLCTPLDGESESTGRQQVFQWMPLSPEKLTEVMKEANMLASQLQKCQLGEKTGLQTVPECKPLPLTRLLQEEKPSFRKTRRRTFDVKSSIMEALLPTVDSETGSAQRSPKAPSPKQGGRASCSVDLPGAKKLQNKPKTLSAEDQQLKKYGLRQSLRASTLMKSTVKKPQVVSRSSRKDRPPPLTSPDNTEHQQSTEHLKPVPRNNRKTAGTTGKDAPCKEPQSSHKDSSRRGTTTVERMKGKPDPKLCPPETRALKKSLAAPKKSMDLQKANTNQSKTAECDEPQLQGISKPHRSSYQIRNTCSTTSQLASRIPVPKATNCTTTSGKCPKTLSRRPSQLQASNVGLPGGKGSPVPTPANKKASTVQQTTSNSPSQNIRLRLRKKTSDNSRR
ncbi:proline/serine-rich coiled-coil protein 1 isoform X2 [Anolis carolinensis]|uniref:proline/serine-rich coiled-coil protein 1 isoform X2 n=1 Tax=Anolis carolinensis TaxID=28377 RepID=UPI002F2B411C